MKSIFKNFLSVLLAFILVFGSLAFGFSDVDWSGLAVKAEAYTIGGFTFSADGMALLSVDKSLSGDVVVPEYGYDPESVSKLPVYVIREDAFKNCTCIKSVTLPDSVIYIYEGAFSGCTSLESITLSSNLVEIDYEAFLNCKSLKSIVIPDKVKTISSDVFMYCESLTSVTLPNSLTMIPDNLFSGCKKLENITIPDSVTSIDSGAFRKCESLTNIVLPSNLTKIESFAFSGCKNLKSITLPDSLTSIGAYAFSGCTKLESIIIPAAVTSISPDAFAVCDGLESITVEEENTAYSSDEHGVLFNKDKTKLLQYPAGNPSESYIIPDGVTSVEYYYAFQNCNSLKSIIFPDGIAEIPTVIVNCANLEFVHIPESVTSLSKYNFKDNEAYICSNAGNCYAKDFADENGIKFVVCKGHNVIIPETTTKPVVTEPETTKPVIVPVEPTTTPVTEPSTTKPVEVPTTTKPSVKEEIIKKPSTTEVKYGETLILHADFSNIPDGVKIEWSVEGEGVTIVPSSDGKTCAVTSTATGDVTVTAKYTDSNGVEHVSKQEIKSNASFWQKIVSFFKNLFGINRIIEQKIKF